MTTTSIASPQRLVAPARSVLDRRGTPLVVGAYVLLAVILTASAWAAPQPAYLGASSDPQQTMWFLAWTPFAISHLHNPLLSDYMNYPQGFNLMWQTWIPLAGVLLWPVTAIWGPLASYNLAVTGAMVLAAVFAFFAIRRFVPATIPAAAGALVYGFSPFVIGQAVAHAHMVLSAVTPPLALLLLDELLVRQRLPTLRLAAMIAALAVAQFFIAEEVFVTEILAGAVVALILALSHRSSARRHLGYAWRVLRAAVPVVAVVLAIPIAVQLLGPGGFGGVVHTDADLYVTDVFNLFVPTSIQWLAPGPAQAIAAHYSGNLSEWNGYLGLPLIVVLGVALRHYWRIPLFRVAGCSASVITVLSLGAHLHAFGRTNDWPGPWWVVAHLPLLRNLQANRLTVYVFLAAGIGIAFVLHRLAGGGRRRWRAVAVGAVTLLPQVPATPLTTTVLTQPAYFTSAAVRQIPDGSVAVTAPWPDLHYPSGFAWQFGAGLRFRVLGGYVIGPPTTAAGTMQRALHTVAATHAAPPLDSAGRQAMLAELRANRVRVVIAGPSPDMQEYVRFLTDLLGTPATSTGGVDAWSLPGPVA